MTAELHGGLPFRLYVRAHRALLTQFLFGFLALALSVWFKTQGDILFHALLEILAAFGLLVFAANFIGFMLRWKNIRSGHFTATAKIVDVTRNVKNPGSRTYTVEFPDPEGVRRTCTIKSEPWETLAYERGDEITVLYDPLNPRAITNYSAYELLK